MLATIAGRRPVSAVTGDLPMDLDLPQPGRGNCRDRCRFGQGRALSDPAIHDCIRALAGPAWSARLVGVLFADRSPDFELVTALAAAGFTGAMIDTAARAAGRSPPISAPISSPACWRCRKHRLLCGLAGGLEPPDVPRLLALKPDVLVEVRVRP